MIKIKRLLLWLLIILLISSATGSSVALFLYMLEFVSKYRDSHISIIYFLPLIGLLIGLLYKYYGESVDHGNKLIVEEFKNPQKEIPFRMAPFIFLSTISSHLVGASVGREGSAVQMGVAIANRITKFFNTEKFDRKVLLVIGISSGFAAVFGTPLAASVFAIEVFHLRKIEYKYYLYSIIAAYLAHYVCLACGAEHSIYKIINIPPISSMNVLWSVVAGLIFGIVAYLFAKSLSLFSQLASHINRTELRPFLAGLLIVALYYFFDMKKYMGLGLSSISASFEENMQAYDFLIKLLLTTFTISFGFKGGEVTPLFFIGACLGNVLIWFIPLPLSLLAGMGFVAVFAGATKTPIACILMGVEMFGPESVFYTSIACIIAYFCSGKMSVYADNR